MGCHQHGPDDLGCDRLQKLVEWDTIARTWFSTIYWAAVRLIQFERIFGVSRPYWTVGSRSEKAMDEVRLATLFLIRDHHSRKDQRGFGWLPPLRTSYSI
jgi:hypothetical protein